MRDTVRAIITGIEPGDDIEATHRRDALDWIDAGADLFRRVKPATPPKHLVAYCLLVDERVERALLVDHRDARRWLPTGGHVEPDEHPVTAARREIAEELGVEPRFHPIAGERPSFLTVTETSGRSEVHTDVSLWFVFEGSPDRAVAPDPGEFRAARWWTFDEIVELPPTDVEPHLARCLTKLRAGIG